MKITKTFFKQEIEISMDEINGLMTKHPEMIEVLSRIISRLINAVSNSEQIKNFKFKDDK
jgi:hypothetical protein